MIPLPQKRMTFSEHQSRSVPLAGVLAAPPARRRRHHEPGTANCESISLCPLQPSNDPSTNSPWPDSRSSAQRIDQLHYGVCKERLGKRRGGCCREAVNLAFVAVNLKDPSTGEYREKRRKMPGCGPDRAWSGSASPASREPESRRKRPVRANSGQ